MILNDVDINKTLNINITTSFSSFTGDHTKTSTFLLPMLGMYHYNKPLSNYFVNCYLDDLSLDHDYRRPLFLLLKSSNILNLNWLDFYTSLKKLDTFVYDYYVGTLSNNKHLYMLVFETPEKWKSDYYLFKRGRYSKFSEEYKKLFPKIIKNLFQKNVESLAYGVIHKTEKLKKEVEEILKLEKGFVDSLEEIWDLPRKEEEYFGINKNENINEK